MKKLFLISLAAVLFVAFGFNQATAQKLGLRAGAGFSNINVTDGNFDYDTDSRVGIILAVNYEVPVFGEVLRIVPEVEYAMKGYKWDYEGETFSERYNYLTLAANAKVKPPFIPVYAIAGPYFSYLASGNYDVMDANGDMSKESIDFDEAGYEDMNRTEFGMAVGAGVQFDLPGMGVFVEGRYGVPFTDLYDITDLTVKNKYIVVSVGILFGR